MKTLIVTNHFYPEVFRVNDVAFELVQKGDEVTVITCIPNYPAGHYLPGYGLFSKRKEVINGVKIIRVPVIPRGEGGGIRLFLNYISYLFFASICAFFLSFRKKFDRIFVHETSPVTVGIPAVIVKKIQRIPLFFWVLDLWPESLRAAGGVNNKTILSLFEKITCFLYKNSDKILMGSEGYRDSILAKGNFKDKLIYFPNWGEDIFEQQVVEKCPELPVGFRIMYAGNIGEAQGFEAIMETALQLKELCPEVKWLLVGDGRKKAWVDEFIKIHQLENTVYALGRFPITQMPALFRSSQAMLVSLKDDLIFNITVPAKLQAYMAAGRPVLAMLNGDGAYIIEKSQCGYAVPAGDYNQLVQIIKEAVLPKKEAFEQRGQKGFEYYIQYFKKDICINHLYEILNYKKQIYDKDIKTPEIMISVQEK